MTTAQRGRGGCAGAPQRLTTGELKPKDVAICLFADAGPPLSMEEGEHYDHAVKNKSGDVVNHRYTSSYSPMSDTPPSRFSVVGIRTPGGGYVKGLMPGLSPQEKGEALLRPRLKG